MLSVRAAEVKDQHTNYARSSTLSEVWKPSLQSLFASSSAQLSRLPMSTRSLVSIAGSMRAIRKTNNQDGG